MIDPGFSISIPPHGIDGDKLATHGLFPRNRTRMTTSFLAEIRITSLLHPLPPFPLTPKYPRRQMPGLLRKNNMPRKYMKTSWQNITSTT